MPKFIFRYPDGLPGLALLFLRVSCAVAGMAIALDPPALSSKPVIPVPAAAFLAFLMVLGFLARPVAVLICILVAAELLMLKGGLWLVLCGHLAGCAALALLGPGAYSADARLFGRQVIRLQGRSPRRGIGE